MSLDAGPSARQARLGPVTLVTEALRLVGARPAVWLVLLVWTALVCARRLVTWEDVVPPDLVSGAYNAAFYGALAAQSLCSGLTVRVLLVGRTGGLDLGLATYVVLAALAVYAPGVLADVAVGPQPASADVGDPETMAFIMRSTVFNLAVLLYNLLLVRLWLWPIGRLLGRSTGPADAWRASRGAFFGFALSMILLGAPLYVAVGYVATLVSRDAGLVVAESARVIAFFAATCLAAAIYRLRTRREADVVDVFD